MTITETNNGEAIELAITGRVDTLTSRELQDTIIAAFQKKKNVILNFASVEYISSAGLRALLLGEGAGEQLNRRFMRMQMRAAQAEEHERKQRDGKERRGQKRKGEALLMLHQEASFCEQRNKHSAPRA